MSREKKFLRQCLACKTIKSKEDLIRITKDSQTQETKINYNNKIKGRSAYICKDIECLETALKRKKIEYSLKCSLSENIKEELYTVLKK